LGSSVLGLFAEDFSHLLLDGFLLQHQAVLVPDKVGSFRIEAVSLHASLEQVNDERVVGVLSKAQAAAVVHKFFELFRAVSAELLDGHLLLLLLDVRVLLLL